MEAHRPPPGKRADFVRPASAARPRRGRPAVLALGATLFLVATGGCAHLGVQPWERDQLARKEMTFGSDPVEAGLDDHIYFSKEASSGGRGFGGGGCGCN